MANGNGNGASAVAPSQGYGSLIPDDPSPVMRRIYQRRAEKSVSGLSAQAPSYGSGAEGGDVFGNPLAANLPQLPPPPSGPTIPLPYGGQVTPIQPGTPPPPRSRLLDLPSAPNVPDWVPGSRWLSGFLQGHEQGHIETGQGAMAPLYGEDFRAQARAQREQADRANVNLPGYQEGKAFAHGLTDLGLGGALMLLPGGPLLKTLAVGPTTYGLGRLFSVAPPEERKGEAWRGGLASAGAAVGGRLLAPFLATPAAMSVLPPFYQRSLQAGLERGLPQALNPAVSDFYSRYGPGFTLPGNVFNLLGPEAVPPGAPPAPASR
jgi:hypothetical protein